MLTGLLSGRFLGPYTAFVAALALVVLGLIAGEAMVGGVTIGGDRDPLMASESMVFITDKMPLMPDQVYEDARFVEGLREAVREGDVETVAAWLYLMVNWWGPMCLVGPAMTFLELYPRLLTPRLVNLIVLWTVVAGAMSWGVWWVKRKSAPIRQAETLPEHCEAEK